MACRARAFERLRRVASALLAASLRLSLRVAALGLLWVWMALPSTSDSPRSIDAGVVGLVILNLLRFALPYVVLFPIVPLLLGDEARTLREARREAARLARGQRWRIVFVALVLLVTVGASTWLWRYAAGLLPGSVAVMVLANVVSSTLSTSLLAAASAVLCEHLRLVADGPEVDDLATTFA
ncbi:MAG: hypothetical protein H6825_00170 [Planctomycetes bacterium]|nr:hypothetical protein [Planctomycetota bacterium]